MERGKPLPDWFLDEPVLEQFEDFYITGFYSLLTERRGGVCIPYSEIRNYGERSGLNSAMLVVFRSVIWTLETAYNKWSKGEEDRHASMNKPSPAARVKKGTFSSK